MTIKEKVAYMEGLAEGMAIDGTKSGKLLVAIIDTLTEMAEELDKLNENALDIGEELDAISDDLADVEEFLEELDVDDDDDDDDGFDFDFDDDDDDYDRGSSGSSGTSSSYGCDYCGKGTAGYTVDVNCPECNAEIELDEVDIANESVTCPACRKLIELEIDEVD